MQVTLTFGLIFLVGFFVKTQGQPGLLGGVHNISEDDKPYVDKAKKMIKDTLTENTKDVEGYKTSLSLTDWDVKKQVVSGILYNFKWKTTYSYAPTGESLQDKPSVTKNCTASVWFKAGSDEVVYAEGKEPQCS